MKSSREAAPPAAGPATAMSNRSLWFWTMLLSGNVLPKVPIWPLGIRYDSPSFTCNACRQNQLLLTKPLCNARPFRSSSIIRIACSLCAGISMCLPAPWQFKCPGYQTGHVPAHRHANVLMCSLANLDVQYVEPGNARTGCCRVAKCPGKPTL